MRFLVLICLFFINVNKTNIVHDSISANFNVIKRGHVLMLEIDFDEENFIKFGEAESLHVSKEDFSKYLHKTTSWEIDGKVAVPQVLTVKNNLHHTKVICYLSEYEKDIKSIKIRNKFLLNVESHFNIIKLDINNTFRDFKLDKERTEIKVDYY